ncbi:MAG TPA: chitobiase/beta-hexosaminidase C-terminal domain-containing protein [Nocardioidaceae bacterium]|nr:chitobiase/beta-hexosaminidase C-terminal domain-containing protein [Nocardioidaceae bacterium]
MALTATALSALPASGTIGPAGVRPGNSITVFHNIDFVAVGGYRLGSRVTVSVVRNGVTIGTASGPARDPEATGAPGLEVNHGPEGTPLAGDCWQGHTPDIRPGDHILVRGDGGTDEVIVDDIRFTGDPAEETPGGDILVPFTAIGADGQAIAVERLDSAEFRAGSRVRFEATDIIVEPAATAGLGEYVMRYPSPFTPSRNRDTLNDAQLRALLLDDGHAIGFGHIDPVPAEAMLVDGLADTPGPAPGCESAASATNGVATVTPSVINGRTPAGATLRVEGFSDSAGAVEVTLSDADGTSVSASAVIEGAGLQTWSVDFTADQLADLEGNIAVSATVDGIESGISKTVIKDTVAPDGPSASLPAGTYRRAQRVSLVAGPSDQIRYTLGAQAAPTANSGTLYRGGQIRIAASRTLKMIAIDEAGNVSPVVRQRYRILRAPSRPQIARARGGDRGGRTTAVATWNPPASSNGSRITGYSVTALKLAPNGSVASRKRARALPARARSVEMRLSAGRYRFQVRAINALGAGPWSARSNAVRAR